MTAAAGLAVAVPARAELRLTIQNGRVSLVAKDATLQQILAEWAKVGQTTIVNGERVPGGPLTLQLTDVPEEQALDTLLRALSGYVAAPRATATPGMSHFDRIVVMPTLAVPTSGAVSAAATSRFPQPIYSEAGPPEQDQRPFAFEDYSADDEVNLNRPGSVPQPQPAAGGVQPPGAPATPNGRPTGQSPVALPAIPAGVAVPGTMAAPSQPTPQAAPNQPAQHAVPPGEEPL